jgi:hypothetical protein
VTSTSSLKLIDLEVSTDVYDRASTRLVTVQMRERSLHGVAKTDLTDVGRAALTNWTPPAEENGGRRGPLVVIEDVSAGGYRARCTVCETTWPGETRQAARSASRGHAREAHMSTFRFSMHRATYEQIKAGIHRSGLSVAQVVQDGLESFAESGEH